jgi:hypothetical protein
LGCDSSTVAEAQRLVARQAGCSLDRALVLLEETAVAAEETLEYVAALVVAGEVWFDPESPSEE